MCRRCIPDSIDFAPVEGHAVVAVSWPEKGKQNLEFGPAAYNVRRCRLRSRSIVETRAKPSFMSECIQQLD